MAHEDESCRRCGAVRVTRAAPSDDGSLLRKRTDHVLDTRARRRMARARRDRHSGAD
jgi:hypothetical protein